MNFYPKNLRGIVTAFLFSICICQQATAKENFNDEYFLRNLKQNNFSIDPSAVAVVLYEKSTVDISPDNGWVVSQKVHRIIKVIRKEGLDQADVLVATFHVNGSFAEIKKIAGTTYNLENGQMQQQQLNTDLVTAEKDYMFLTRKFSMPSVKEGSIIDYTYTIRHDFGLMYTDWTFQDGIPCLYSELETTIPVIFDTRSMTQGNLQFVELPNGPRKIADSLLPESFRYSEIVNGNEFKNSHWVRRNIPALEEEPFVASVNNYKEKIKLQITGTTKNSFSVNFLNTWPKLNKALYESFSFYRPLVLRHEDIGRVAKELTASLNDETEKAKAIYNYVRKNISAKENSGIWSTRDLNDVFVKHTGTPAEINLVMIAMMKAAGLNCDPVILSTRENGKIYDAFPALTGFNHTIGMLVVGSETYYLDASEKYNPFGTLPEQCYNGYARLVNQNGGSVNLLPEMNKNKGMVVVTTENADPQHYTLNFKQYFTKAEAAGLRAEWSADTTEIRKHLIKSLKVLSLNAALKTYEIQNLDNPESALTLNYTVSLSWPSGKSVYFTPVFMNRYSSNPFKANERIYPVEMDGVTDYSYSLQLKIPDGFTLEEMPKSSITTIDEKDEYKFMTQYDKETNTLRLNARLQMLRTDFQTEEYPVVRAFFDKILAANQQKIILK
ncbi:DUF3857 domain-containing protein [Taibaiella soli]|uniref:Transglutaminase-like domain-containing protein n=1 Tax=Taibaiella soli TaxID=1649169 RepID=A0A2W2B3S8_9BACT|nr:DUF3857 domain-containing protein [Taibaiella soli]PZF70879.1 hypothetical protein DN068_20860 [Taibaiella soli]